MDIPASDGSGATGEGPTVEAGIAQRTAARVQRHPLVVVGVLAGIVAVAQAIWIWRVRHLGGFDPDESSYLSSALQMQSSIDLGHPFAFPTTVAATGHGITVPLLSVPLLIVGPRDPRTAMLVQPILLVLIAVAIAGITLRITRRAFPAVFAGVWVVVLPTVITAVQSYWYGLGAAAAMAVAIWALLASERATNRYVWCYGVAIGLMCLTRTMTIGYLPAVGVAGLIVAWPDRRALKRVVGAVALGLAVAAPWYLVNLHSIFEYLFTFGYGGGAAEFGETAFGDRVNLRYDRMVEGMAFKGLVPLAVLVLLYVVVRLALGHRFPRLEERGFLAVAAVVVLGTVALVSTANNGVWFELPLVVLAVAVLVAAAAQLPRPAAVLLGVLVLIPPVSSVPVAMWLREWKTGDPASHYEWGFAQYDERFSPETRSEHEQAAADWWALAEDVEQEMRRISPDGHRVTFVTTGNTHLYNAGVVWMAAELDGWDYRYVIPNTTLPAAERAKYLGSADDVAAGRPERVLVVGVHDQILWPLDVETPAFLAQAEAAGFVETARFEMPRGGHVAILRRAGDDVAG